MEAGMEFSTVRLMFADWSNMTIARIAVALSLTAGCLLFAGASNRPAETETAEQSEPQITLQEIQEIRRTTLVETDGGSNTISMNTPGLVLTYGLALPDGTTLHEINQPEQVEAFDSEQNDLSDIKTDFHGTQKYVELEQTWNDEDPTSFTFQLVPAARRAETFSLKATLDLVVFDDTESLTIDPTDQWQQIDAALFPSDEVQARLTTGGFGGDNAQVSFRPSSVRDAIHEVYLIDNDAETKSNSVMWTGREASFGFDQPLRDGQRVRLVIRTEVETIAITIDLQDQPLP